MREYYHHKKYGANPETRVCLKCSKEFLTRPWSNIHYCSQGCKADKSIKRNCLMCDKEIRVMEYRKGQNFWCSVSCSLRYQKGPACRNWKGGLTEKNQLIRNSWEAKEWRKAVFERDNYTCVGCGDDTGGNLEADHIKPFSLFPELRWIVDNGRTLCTPCHKATDTWGKKVYTYKKRLAEKF